MTELFHYSVLNSHLKKMYVCFLTNVGHTVYIAFARDGKKLIHDFYVLKTASNLMHTYCPDVFEVSCHTGSQPRQTHMSASLVLYFLT